METFWFWALAVMIVVYVILDGFDLGTGILFLRSAKTDKERRTLLKAIGPVWDGNEVWLLAAGGILFFAFPRLYAASFSGFYLPLILVLWLLIGRALGIELRKHVDNVLWKSFWDVVFSVSSILLTVVFGAALGDIIRGVPLEQNGYFFEALWISFMVELYAGILDWYTVLMALVAVATLTLHGANYLAVKTENLLQFRLRNASRLAGLTTITLSLVMFAVTTSIRPELWDNYLLNPVAFIFPAISLFAMVGIIYYRHKENDRMSFVSSGVFIFAMLAGTAFGLYPNLLPSTISPSYSLTITNSQAGEYGLKVGLYWWIVGIILAGGYFWYLFRSFKGKVKMSEDEAY